ncbi:protein-disulfide reductase DsbD [Oceaniserpentilla sp. 4NH20-0058]|uniref:protein-disulfide reductase DsbD n=1 Tax=Oceaniserpentilla sp. 4NH20-0058 TaxID=3127660 RepID=UPI003341E55C
MLQRILLTVFVFLLHLPLSQANMFGGSSETAGPLPANKAMQFSTTQNSHMLRVEFILADNIYLYRDKFKLTLTDKSPYSQFQFIEKAQTISDPNFGDVSVFFYSATVDIDLSQLPKNTQQLTMRYQGCDQEIGLCYPPQATTLNIEPFSAQTSINQPTDKDLSQASGILGFLQNAGISLILLTFLVLGMGLTFTPCVLPMMPIISSIIAGQNSLSAKRGLVLSSVYVLGMALTFALAGVLVGSLGARFNIQIYMQQPWVLSIFAALFGVLALAMFGLFELRLPRFIQEPLDNLNQKQKGGSLIGVFLMGGLSAIVVSPCVSAPLAGALLYISTTSDALLGGLALFALGLGMGLPLIAIGTGGAHLMPKAGAWMDSVKYFFGVLLLAVALWLLGRFIPETLYTSGWILLIAVYAVVLGAFEPAPSNKQRIIKAFALLGFSLSVALIFKLTLGLPIAPSSISGTENTQTNKVVQKTTDTFFQSISDQVQLEQTLLNAKEQEKIVFLDIYADWCIECKIMSNTLFKDPEVQASLENFVRIKFDITTFDDFHKSYLESHNLFGPPALLFYGLDGKLITEANILGEINKTDFINHLQQFDP